jgi:hypothetical protein
MVLEDYVEPFMLPEKYRLWFEDNRTKKQIRKISHDGFKELKFFIINKGRYPNIRENGGERIWEDELEGTKATINQDPEVAVSTFLSWPDGWTLEEITDVATRNPRAAYALAVKQPNADIPTLQDACRPDPKIAYLFARDVPNANKSLAVEQASPSAYWQYRTLKHRKEETDAESLLLTRVAYEPEAAALWLRLQPNDCKELPICLASLGTSPEDSYLLALAKKNDWKPEVFDELEENPHCPFWTKLRTTALSNPQWAYHWWTNIEPENAITNLHTVAYHPGWAAQFIEDIGQIYPKRKMDMIAATDSLIRDLFTNDDPFYSAFVIWAADTAMALNQGDQDPNTETDPSHPESDPSDQPNPMTQTED